MPNLTGNALRGVFHADAEGKFVFRTIKPAFYPIPYDGPVGRLLLATGSHPYRPAHIHFIVSAEDYRPVTTEIFAEGDPYVDSDVVFGVRDSLVVPLYVTSRSTKPRDDTSPRHSTASSSTSCIEPA